MTMSLFPVLSPLGIPEAR